MELTLILPVITAVLAGLFSFFVVHVTQRVTQQRERMQYICTKLERTYLLAQSLYDGHRAEIEKYAAVQNLAVPDWIKNRKHPGDIMSELKMTVRMYAPDLESTLNNVDVAHQALKTAFQEIDESVQMNIPSLSPKDRTLSELRNNLTLLGENLNVLKAMLIGKVHFVLNLHAGSIRRIWKKERRGSENGSNA